MGSRFSSVRESRKTREFVRLGRYVAIAAVIIAVASGILAAYRLHELTTNADVPLHFLIRLVALTAAAVGFLLLALFIPDKCRLLKEILEKDAEIARLKATGQGGGVKA